MQEFVNDMKPLVPTLKRIVEAEEAKTWLSIKVANFLKMAGIVIGGLGGLFGIGWAIWRELKK